MAQSGGMATLSLSLLLLLLASAAPTEARGRNVLLVIVDDLRPEIGSYGQKHVKTPHLDRFAGSALLFDRAYTQFAVCCPSRSSFLTGRSPDTTMAWTNGHSWRRTGAGAEHWVPLPEFFKQLGYLTLGGGKTYHPGDPLLWDIGRSWSQTHVTTKTTDPMGYFNFQLTYCPDELNTTKPSLDTWCPLDGDFDQFFDYRLANWTLNALAHVTAQTKPWFIAAGFRRPHTPFKMPTAFWEMYNESEIVLATNAAFPTNAPAIAYHQAGFDIGSVNGAKPTLIKMKPDINRPFPDDISRAIRRAYYACVSFQDSQIGRVLSAVDALPVAQQPVVALVGDHGWHLGEYSMYHKFANFELTTRVPFIVRSPAHPASAGKRTAALAGLIDLYPTLASLAEVSKPTDPIEGVDLSSVFESPELPLLQLGLGPREAVFSQYPRCPKPGQNESHSPGACTPGPPTAHGEYTALWVGYTVRVDTWRYTAWMDWNNHTRSVDWAGRPHAQELYSHEPGTESGLSGCSVDFNLCENANVVGKAANAATRLKLFGLLRTQFGQR
jgi:iduronate 2-sulfatase